jgi:hypothetical protein
VSHVTLARLKSKSKRLRITNDRIADEAGVGRTLVVHVLAGRAKSANVVKTIKRLIAEEVGLVVNEQMQNGAPVALTRGKGA